MIEEIDKSVESMIYEIRGVQVMLDSDLAKLYGCKNGAKSINLAVKRHIDRFPEDFYFQLNDEESKIIWFQIETKKDNIETRGGKYHNPYVFTEEGVSMLASVLRTENASIVSVSIMRAFVKMRHFIKDNKIVLESVVNLSNKIENHEQKLIEHDNKFEELFSNFERNEEKEFIYFNGMVYDSYSKILDIMTSAKNELIIIDAYADKSVLDMISKLDVKVILIVRSKSILSDREISLYNEQYNNLKVVYSDTFHDRYFILDKSIIYHCGTSINYAGKKTFGINKLEDESVIDSLLEKINKIIYDL